MIRWTTTAVYLLLLSYLLLSPDPFAIPRAIFGTQGQGGKPIALLESLNDKVVHSTSFAILAMLSAWSTRGRRLLSIALFAVAYGGVTEVIQAFVPPRTCDWADWLADCTGAAVGLGAASLLYRWTKPSPLEGAPKSG